MVDFLLFGLEANLSISTKDDIIFVLINHNWNLQ